MPEVPKLLNPFLAGRDIKRYQQPHSDKFLIFTKRGIDIDQYPAVKQYLFAFRDRLEPKPKDYKHDDWPGRKAGSYQWFEIQDAVDYYEEFEKEKIIIPAITNKANYCFDDQHFYSNDKTAIITEVSKYILALLNSQLLDFYIKRIASTKQNGFYEYKPVYVSQLPIAQISLEHKLLLNQKVDDILNLKKQSADTAPLEAEIDQLVYQLYGLTADEIQLVEGS